MENTVKLPDEIVELIFFKLPTISLIRFKSVSNAWKHLISNPRFVHQHYTQRLIEKRECTNPSTTFLVYTHQYSPTPNNYFTRVSISCTGRKLNDKHKLEDTLWLPFFACDPELLGSGSGFVYPAGFGIYCLFQFWYENKKVALWNPAIRELTELHWPSLHSEPESYDYGFGHVEYDDNVFSYKVGLVHITYDLDKDEFCLSIELYSSREKSWKLFKDIYYGKGRLLNGKWQHYGTNLNGKFYFLPWFSGEVRRIVTFDMTTHKFGSVKVPSFMLEDPHYNLVLTKLDEKFLCLLVYKGDVNEAYLEAWIYMEEEEEEEEEHHESWILKSSIGPIAYPMEVSIPEMSSCLGGVLLQGGDKVTYWRYGSAHIETLPMETSEYEFNKTMEYEESIVSLNGAWDQQQIIRR